MPPDYPNVKTSVIVIFIMINITFIVALCLVILILIKEAIIIIAVVAVTLLCFFAVYEVPSVLMEMEDGSCLQ